MTLSSQLSKEGILLTGVDAGNTSTKVSYLNKAGDIESFSIPTVIAQADRPNEGIKDLHSKDGVAGERRIYIHLQSSALIQNMRDRFWFVGEFAKNKDNVMEPAVDDKGESKDKFDSPVHIICLLTGLAVAAAKLKKTKVKVPLSCGLPIEEHKRRGGEQFLSNLKGQHIITFHDGEFNGMSIEITIEEGEIHVEGITTTLALEFDVAAGELIETPLQGELDDSFAINDLGAGTTDCALYTEDGLDPHNSKSEPVGTNKYIDAMIREIEALPKVREAIDTYDRRPFKTREQFMRDVIIPQVEKSLENGSSADTKYMFTWGSLGNIDVTDIVTKHMSDYADKALGIINDFWFSHNPEKVGVVGGGLLFAFSQFKNHSDRFIFPTNLKDSPQITSRSYLIANFLNHLERVNS